MKMPVWLKIILGLIALCAMTVAADFLAGAFFLVINKKSPVGTTWMTYYQYWYYYHDDPVFHKRLNIAAIFAGLVAYIVPLFVLIAALREVRSLHGAARFARFDEVEKSGLFASKGILVGKLRNRFLCFSGQEFVALAAPTRSGKGVGVVIPNCLNYSDSMVVFDPKQENFDITAGFRAKHGQEVHLFNPFAEDGRTSRYNPLSYVRAGDFRVADLTAIGEVFYPADSGNSKDSFFDDQARNLFVGIGLYLCETPALPLTIGEMLRQSSGKGQPVKQHLLGLIDKRNFEDVEEEVDAVDAKTGEPIVDKDTGEVKREKITKRVPIEEWNGEGDPPLSMECVDSLNRFCNTSDNTMSSILASFNAPLGIWTNPIVDAATSENDFDLRAVRKRRMSIYVGITPDYLPVAGRLVNLLFSQLVNLNTKELPQSNPELKYQCMLLMDEFTAMGRITIIEKAVSYIAGYNLRLVPIFQSVSQLAHVYGQESARNFLTNHAVQILFAPREQRDANEYSEMLGYETVKAVGTSRQKGGKGGESESQSDHRRALLLPQEIKEIGKDKEIVLLEDVKPVMADKIMWYKDRVFVERLKSVSPMLRAKCKDVIDREVLRDAIKAGELAPIVPKLDMDTHRARVETRVRALSPSDVVDTVDLRKLAMDTSKLKLPPESECTAEDVQNFVAGFFDALDAGSLGDDDESTTEDGDAPVVAMIPAPKPVAAAPTSKPASKPAPGGLDLSGLTLAMSASVVGAPLAVTDEPQSQAPAGPVVVVSQPAELLHEASDEVAEGESYEADEFTAADALAAVGSADMQDEAEEMDAVMMAFYASQPDSAMESETFIDEHEVSASQGTVSSVKLPLLDLSVLDKS